MKTGYILGSPNKEVRVEPSHRTMETRCVRFTDPDTRVTLKRYSHIKYIHKVGSTQADRNMVGAMEFHFMVTQICRT